MTISVLLRCDRCRGDSLSIPLEGGEETEIDCEDCGASLGTLADLKTMVSLKVVGRKHAKRPAFSHWG